MNKKSIIFAGILLTILILPVFTAAEEFTVYPQDIDFGILAQESGAGSNRYGSIEISYSGPVQYVDISIQGHHPEDLTPTPYLWNVTNNVHLINPLAAKTFIKQHPPPELPEWYMYLDSNGNLPIIINAEVNYDTWSVGNWALIQRAYNADKIGKYRMKLVFTAIGHDGLSDPPTQAMLNSAVSETDL